MRRIIPVRRSHAAGWARLAGALTFPVLLIGALGLRAGFVPPGALLPVLVLGFALALTALALAIYSLTDIWNSGAEGAGVAIAGIFYASPALALLAAVSAAAIVYPPLTDVSTDTSDPPGLIDRVGQEQTLAEEERIALQVAAYPDLAPRLYGRPIAEVYAAARKIVDDRGWDVAREFPPAAPLPEAEADSAVPREEAVIPVPSAGMSTGPEAASIQAVARTLVFGFPDDVVLRFRETGEGTRVDMRSASRTGMHDLGQNARRIRAFMADLDAAFQPKPGR